MEKSIPLHSLVFCSTNEQLNKFSQHERLSNRLIERDLVGDDSRIDLSAIVYDELRHRASLKLSLGERVAIYAGDLAAEAKNLLSAIAVNQGASVIEMEPDFVPTVAKIPLNTIQATWQGITVVGDIHGNNKALTEALSWSHSRNHFTWLLGDVIDYGEDTLKSMTTVYRAVMDGRASLIIGNHEKKIAKWLDQKENGNRTHMRISDGNKVTIAALNKLNPTERKQWIGQFRSLLAHASLMFQMNNITLVHAAVHPSLWTNKPDEKEIEKLALYGEDEQIGGKYKRTHKWMDFVPSDQMVFIGHDVLHEYPIMRTGKKGGQIVCLDTGSGKGGALSSADLKFSDDGLLRLECFKRY